MTVSGTLDTSNHQTANTSAVAVAARQTPVA
jgi:hypothetical protein